jgi:pseudouridylate synthase
MHTTHSHLVYSAEVQQARLIGLPVVALESTIITHGMPFPQNLEVAMEVESTVRLNGAVPATIAILNGRVHIGLDATEMETLAQSKDAIKCSRRDLPFVIAKGLNGATTVASTMLFAHQAGIRFFATGGIGGVHRQAEMTWDVSADLFEFTHSHVAVFSAGAKAILDLPKTLEYLETLGVPVFGFQTAEFPAFYARQSGLPLNMAVEHEQELATILKTGWSSETLKGALVANPIPSEFALDGAWMEQQINVAIAKANEEKISGKALTPYLLKSLHQLTEGKSQAANRALVLHNAAVAAKVAAVYSNLP